MYQVGCLPILGVLINILSTACGIVDSGTYPVLEQTGVYYMLGGL